jgi:hypothetical protein
MAGDCHGNTLGHASANHVPYRRASKIMEYQSDETLLLECSLFAAIRTNCAIHGC